jgi:serine-type D-Ala-D-Ala carboxypeptidase
MSRMEQRPELDAIVAELVVEPGAAPGGTIALSALVGTGRRWAVGAAGRRASSPRAARVTPLTPYDLASVTKPFVAVTAARLARAGLLDLAAPLGHLLPEARGTASEHVALELLLAHRAGLEPHREFFRALARQRPFCRASALIEACAARRPECQGAAPPAGFPALYSDLGYLLVGEALSRCRAAALDALVHEHVAGPLALDVGSARQWLARGAAFATHVAPTETIGWRGGPITGIVHDENAWALAGHGSAGQAGLFGTAGSVLRFGCALLDVVGGTERSWLAASDLEPLVRERPDSSLRAGFDGRSAGTSAAGSRAGSRTFGHLGFTGTSLWCDPDAQIVTVLLTNRVCPSREDLRLRAARPRVQDALYALADRWRSGQGA